MDRTDTVMEFNIGLMELNIMGAGKKIKPVEKESLYTPMEIYIKVNGKMIRLLALEFTFIQSLKLNMKVIGKTI